MSAQSFNQMTRWVNTKEEHCSKIIELISTYCLCQRVKPFGADKSPFKSKFGDDSSARTAQEELTSWQSLCILPASHTRIRMCTVAFLRAAAKDYIDALTAHHNVMIVSVPYIRPILREAHPSVCLDFCFGSTLKAHTVVYYILTSYSSISRCRQAAMKAKQTVDVAGADKLDSSVDEFSKMYLPV